MRSNEFSRTLALLLPSALLAADAWAGPKAVREIPVEVLRLETSATTGASGGQGSPVAKLVGPPALDAFVIRFELAPGERLLSARGLVRDGLAHHTAKPRKARRAARLLATLGVTVVTRDLPNDLRPGLGSLAGLVLPLGQEAAAPKAARVLVLRGEAFHHRDGHAAAVVSLEANELTRVTFERISIRARERPKKRRGFTAPVSLRGASEVTREELLQLVAGPSGKRRKQGRPPRRREPAAEGGGPEPFAAPHR